MPISSQYTIWLFWFILVLLNTIVFLNFLIAVIGDVYTEVMATKTEQIFRGKARLIVEIQNVFSIFKRLKIKSHLLVTRQSQLDQDEMSWKGIVPLSTVGLD